MYVYQLTEALASLLDGIETLRSALDTRGVLPRRWLGRLRREPETEAIAACMSMESSQVRVEDVRRILAHDRPSGVSERDAALVVGYRDAMDFVLRRSDAAGFTWQSELVVAIHDRVMGGDFAAGAGSFRRGQVFVGSATRGLVYLPPAAEAVPSLIDALTEWLDQAEAMGIPVALQAALAHIRLAGIHPFSDGNGRVARILASMVMLRGGYRLPEFTSLEEWWGAHQDRYYRAFDCLGPAWDPEADVTPFLLAHLQAQVTQIEALSLRHATEAAIWTLLEDLVTEDLDGPPRLANALFDAFFGRDITNRYYRGLVDLGPATAASDLRRLRAAGLLRSEGAGRGTRYLGTPELMLAVAGAAGLERPDRQAPLEALRASLVADLATRIHPAPMP